jgi:hypothetical protein
MIMANALWSKDPTPSTSSRAPVPQVWASLWHGITAPITFIVSLFADDLPLTAVRPSENCTLIGKSSGSLSYGRAERYRNIYLLLLAIPRGARQTLPDSLLQLIVFRPVVVTMPVTRTVLPRQFGSCRSAPAESVMEVFAVLKPGDDSQ